MFPVTLGSIIAPIQATVASLRAVRGLVPLTGPDGVGTGTIALGQEYLNFQLAPPMIIVVPRDEPFGEEEYDGRLDGTGPTPPRRILTSRMIFEAWCWGDEDPNFAETQSTAYSFDSTIELRREFLLGLEALGGTPAMRASDLRGRWEQPANEKRLGRLYVLTFSIKLGVDDDAYTAVPFATSTTQGLTMIATIVATSPDGSSTQQMGTVIVPPP